MKDLYDAFPSDYKIEHKCVRLWTLESPIYHEITQSLYMDNVKMIKKYMPIIRGINKGIKGIMEYPHISH